MSKLKLTAVCNIVINLVLLLVYFICKTEKDVSPILSIENAQILLITFVMLTLSYWMITLVENKEFIKFDEKIKYSGIRGIINSTYFAYWFFVVIGFSGIFLITYILFLGFYEITS